MKKRIISLLLAAAMTFSLTACGGNSSDDKKEETKTENTDNKETPEVDTIHWARANSGNILVTIAKQQGYFDEVGINVIEDPVESSTAALVVLVYAEMYGAKFGMGFYVKKFAEYGLYSEAWSGFIFMVVVLVIVMQIFEKMKNRILRWTIN